MLTSRISNIIAWHRSLTSCDTSRFRLRPRQAASGNKIVKSLVKRLFIAIILLGIAGALGWAVYDRIQTINEEAASGGKKERKPAPVEVVAVRQGPIALRRTFSGTLEPTERFSVAPKVSGRIEKLNVDLADIVKRGQVVAQLDNAEYVQAIAAAEADLAVAKANVTEATNALEIARRELKRIDTLRDRGVTSESQYDTARAQVLSQESRLAVANAQVTRAESAVETTKIRLGYTTVTADWAGGDDSRVVSERYASAGDTVSANASLLSIVEIDPIKGVIFVTEKDYARLAPGQTVSITTDAYPGETFEGSIARISPVFRESSRQARVELTVPNTDRRLKPGMFIRSNVVLEQLDEATIVPAQAITRRDDKDGVFMVNEDELTVSWMPLELGIREGDEIQLKADASSFTGRVVTLGQQMIDDGTQVTIPGDEQPAAAEATTNNAANGEIGG